MRHYTKILVWENRKRLKKLIDFRELVIVYFNNSRVEWIMDPRVEEEAAQEARSNINLSMKEAHSTILLSGTNPKLIWKAPPTAGGYVAKIDLIEDIFNLHEFQLDPRLVLDQIDRAIGIYQSNQKKARARVFNPLFYVEMILDFISNLPFIALGKLGFNRHKMTISAIGRLVKQLVFLITVLATVLTILHFLEFLNPVKQFVHRLLGFNNSK